MKRHPTPVLAVDLGGTKIRAGIVGRDFRIRQNRVVPTPTASSAAVLNSLLGLVYTYDRSEYRDIAIAFAGLTTWPAGLVLTAPSLPTVTNLPLRRYLERVTRRRVTVDNDVSLWTLGEAVRGAGRSYKRVAGLVLGTGVGGGFVVDRSVVRTKDNLTEFGHMTIADGGPADQHGGRGHLESLAGGWAISRAYHRATGRTLTTREIAERARRGDRTAQTVFQRAGRAVALGLSNIVNLINPDVIILGGSVSKAPGLVSQAAWELQHHLLHPSLRTPVVRAKLGDNAPLIGAAYLARST